MSAKTSFKAEIKTEWIITFHDPEKAKAFFIDGDWKDYFFTFNGLKDLSEHLAFAFHNDPERWSKEQSADYRSPEGFGDYYKQSGKDVYTMTPKDHDQGDEGDPGVISITLETETEVEFISEL